MDAAFSMTCDPARSHKKVVESLLDAGVHVALLYGDADFRSDCTFHNFQRIVLGY